ncbi:hypothetical protein FBU30_007939 [Linnemannia zychae]|nr:hypothetical protein FBU30_007939 [Linnemannia zychae]
MTASSSSQVTQNTEPLQPTPAQRMISACAGSLLTSLLMTPLDVVKTRLQSQTVVATPTCAVPFSYTSNATAYEKLCTCCREVFLPPSSQTLSAETAGVRQSLAGVVAGAGSHTHTHDPYHHLHHAPGYESNTLAGMKASRIQFQYQSLEHSAANCFVHGPAHKAAQERYFHGTWDGVKKIARHEGASSLWRGLSPTLAMSIPATVIYFVGYDYLRDVLSKQAAALSPGLVFGQTFIYEYRDSLAPLLAGGFARTVAATVISPIELFRTRMQSVHTDTKGNAGLFRGVSQGIVAMVRSEGVLSLWRGLAPTLWRDVPFSAIYWVGYENTKKRIVAWDREKAHPVLNEFEVAFASGALSGMIAATLTTPFDVAKTRRQVDLLQPVHTKMFSLMKAIIAEEGYRGLWRGLTARIAKVAPSCAIMISSYEIGKKALTENWWGLGTPSEGPSSSESSSSKGGPTNEGTSSSAPGSPASSGGSGAPTGNGHEVLLMRDRTAAFSRLAGSTTASSTV